MKCLSNYSGFICVTETPTGSCIRGVAAVCGGIKGSRTESSKSVNVEPCPRSSTSVSERACICFLRAELICAFLLCKQRQMCVDWDLRF